VVTVRPPGEPGIHPTAAQSKTVRDFIAKAEEKGLDNIPQNRVVRTVFHDLVSSHAHSFQAFYASAGVALVGALACALLVTEQPRTLDHPIFGRRSRPAATRIRRVWGCSARGSLNATASRAETTS
jgi:hypothetical protein